MIVCVCNAVCERHLEMVVAAGAHTPEAVEQKCGAGGDCGACRPDVEQVIDRVIARISVGPRSQPAERAPVPAAAAAADRAA